MALPTRMASGANGEKTMPSERVVVQFIVSAEMPNDEASMDEVLSSLPGALEDIVPEAANVFADIMDVEPIA